MNAQKNPLAWVSTGVFASIVASLCCITPVLAMLAGASGVAASFSWLEPFRPWLAGLSIVVLGVVWYQKLKPQPADVDCACEETTQASFWQSKTFLGIVTVFAVLMLAFPYYSQIFYPDNSQKEVLVVKESDLRKVVFDVTGMTCSGCEAHIEHAVSGLAGVVSVDASYEKGQAEVVYDEHLLSIEQIVQVIDSTGYKAMHWKAVGR